MVEQLAVYLSDILIQMGTAREKERPFLVYGLFCIISGTLQIVLLFVVSLFFHTTIQVAVYSFCFGILKRTIGGWHANSHAACLTLFTSLAIGCTQLGQRLALSLVRPAALVLAASMLVIVWNKAPAEHPNNPQTPVRLAELRQVSRGIAGVEAAAIAVLTFLLAGTWFYRLTLYAAMGSFTAAFALLIPNRLPDES